MRLRSIEYSQHLNDPRRWVLRKTRLLNIIAGLANIITGARPIFTDGSYEVVFIAENDDELLLKLVIEDNIVKSESLIIDNKTLLQRNADGTGKIWTRDIDGDLDFKVPNDQLAMLVKRDSIQHEFLEPIYKWAKYTLHHRFADNKDKNTLISFSKNKRDPNTGALHPVILMKKGADKFSGNLLKAVIDDLEKLEYYVTDVGIGMPDDIEVVDGPPVMGLYVKEKDLTCITSQIQMSEGMFRALSLIIRLNYSMLNNDNALFLIDDIGEGLDYKRAQSIVDLTMDKANNTEIQVITSTNDQFIMNGVPLDYWSIVDRKSSIVSIINAENTPKVFEKYKTVGLNNFEFFASDFFLGQ